MNENLKKCAILDDQKGTRYILGKVYFIIIIVGCLLSTNACLRFLLILICFAREIKGFYQSSIGNKVDFSGIMNVSSNISAKQISRHCFVDEGAMITTTLKSSCQWKTLAPLCLRKKRPKRAFLTLTVNYCKIVQKNKLCYSKQH